MSNLKSALSEIESILRIHDLTGIVVIHSPEGTESLVKFDASFSCAKLEGDKVKVRAKLEHFKGNKKLREKKLQDTANMLKLLTEHTVETVYPYVEISEKLEKAIEDDKRRDQV